MIDICEFYGQFTNATLIKKALSWLKENEILQKIGNFLEPVWRYSLINYTAFKESSGKDKALRILYTLGLSLVVFILALELNFLWLFGKMPTLNEAKNPKLAVPSKLYSEENKIIGRFYIENRNPIAFEEIGSQTIDALIATEDVRFFEHNGLDLRSITSAVFATITGDARGGSTINQQLVKNLFKTRGKKYNGLLGYIPGVRTIVAKLKEWDVALKMDFFFEKEEILALYLNAVDYGDNTYGLKLAAEHFFSKKPMDLEVQEAALLIGVLKGTTYYNPVKHPERALERRNVVLDQMLKYEKIDKEAYDEAVKKPLGLKITKVTKEDSGVPYLKRYLQPILEKWCEKNGLNLYTDGLKIYTGINSEMQKAAEIAMQEHLNVMQRLLDAEQGSGSYWFDRQIAREKGEYRQEHPGVKELPLMPAEIELARLVKKTDAYKSLKANGLSHEQIMEQFQEKHKTEILTHDGTFKPVTMSTLDSVKYMAQYLQAGLLSIDPHTMKVKAWVGGTNFDQFRYDHVSQAGRQPGSSFKPIIYTSALENGVDPCTTIVDKPFAIETIINGKRAKWEPKNSTGRFTYSQMTMRMAIGRSVNSVAIRTLEGLGTKKVLETAKKLGIQSKLEPNLSLALGTSNVTLLELVRAYVPFANLGKQGDLVLFTKILSKDDEVLYEDKTQMKQVISPETAYVMSHNLKGSVEDAGGTSRSLIGYGICDNNEVGGKTGTTNDYVDGWFMGITPNLVTGVWSACEDSRIHFRSANGQGGRMALPIFGKYMKAVYESKTIKLERGKFPKPEGFDIDLRCYGSFNYERKLDFSDVDSTAIDSVRGALRNLFIGPMPEREIPGVDVDMNTRSGEEVVPLSDNPE